MSNSKSIGSFLTQYNEGEVTIGGQSGLTESDPPPDKVRDWFSQTMGSGDHHVIPLNNFEFRVYGEVQKHEGSSQFVRYSDIIGTVEYAWDKLIADYGLDAVSTYIPFHEDAANYGIYIRQQGIRFLGHLLYQWSRVHGLTSDPDEYETLLQQYDFQSSNRLHFEKPAFESIEDAFDLAREIILRYQWFRHQVELLASYIEDASGTAYYPSYYSQSPNGGTIVETILSNAYVSRSYACRSRTPVTGLYRPLFERMIAKLSSSDKVDYASSDKGFRELRSEVVAEIVGQPSPSASRPLPQGTGLAQLLPFDTDVWSAVPSRLPVYVTRNEFSTDNGSYGPREQPLDPDWSITTSDIWDQSYKAEEGSMRQRADNAVAKLKNNVHHGGFRWKPCKPENRWYFRLNKQFRGIADIYNREFTVELIDFGKHDLPEDYGCRT